MRCCSRAFVFFSLLLSIAVAFSGSCLRNSTDDALKSIEDYLPSYPDSALSSLLAIDSAYLSSRDLRARHALLYAMALDKSSVDTTDIRIIMPAVEYYGKRGSADQKMKAFYYLGRIQENGGDVNSAIISYVNSESSFPHAKDTSFMGLVLFSISDIYRKSYYYDKALEYAQRGLDCFSSARDTSHYYLALGHLADLYRAIREWHSADSLYQAMLPHIERDTAYLSAFLSSYALMKTLQPNPDPNGAVELLRRKVDLGRNLSRKDYGVYALASKLSGDESTCQAILSMLDRHPHLESDNTRYQRYRIAEMQGDYAQAIELLKASYVEQDSIVAKVMRQSVVRSMEEYFEHQSAEKELKLQARQRGWAGIVLILILAIILLIVYFIRKREKAAKEAANLLQAADETQRMLHQEKTLLETDLSRLQRQFICFYRTELERIGSICEAYTKAKDRREIARLEVLYRRVERIVERINMDSESFDVLEQQVNQYLDNVLIHMKEDLKKTGKLSFVDERFLCYTVMGFNPSTIAVLLGIELSYVYVKKGRIKSRLNRVSSPYQDQYAIYFGK